MLIFTDLSETDLFAVNRLMEDSFFILPTMLPTWKAALDGFNNGRYITLMHVTTHVHTITHAPTHTIPL